MRTGTRGLGRRNPVELSAGGLAVLDVAWAAVVRVNEGSSTGLASARRELLDAMLHRLLRRGVG